MEVSFTFVAFRRFAHSLRRCSPTALGTANTPSTPSCSMLPTTPLTPCVTHSQTTVWPPLLTFTTLFAQVLRTLWCARVPMRSQHVVALLAAGLQVLQKT